MCYSVYISTDSKEDLSKRNSELVRFEKVTENNAEPCTQLLEFPNQWYVGSKSGCSCTFRHLMSVELGFTGPEDWCPEEQDEIDATKELYAILSSILSSGHQVDLIDQWEGTKPDEITTLDVSLDKVSATTFRLFDKHKFRLRQTNPSSR